MISKYVCCHWTDLPKYTQTSNFIANHHKHKDTVCMHIAWLRGVANAATTQHRAFKGSYNIRGPFHFGQIFRPHKRPGSMLSLAFRHCIIFRCEPLWRACRRPATDYGTIAHPMSGIISSSITADECSPVNASGRALPLTRLSACLIV